LLTPLLLKQVSHGRFMQNLFCSPNKGGTLKKVENIWYCAIKILSTFAQSTYYPIFAIL